MMKLIRNSDIAVITALLAIAFLFQLFSQVKDKKDGTSAEIYYNSELVMTVDLTAKEDKSFSIPQNPEVVFHLYPDGSICFEQSDCPDKICIHSGKLKHAGESAACLPNRMVLKLVDKNKSDSKGPDIVISG